MNKQINKKSFLVRQTGGKELLHRIYIVSSIIVLLLQIKPNIIGVPTVFSEAEKVFFFSQRRLVCQWYDTRRVNHALYVTIEMKMHTSQNHIAPRFSFFKRTTFIISKSKSLRLQVTTIYMLNSLYISKVYRFFVSYIRRCRRLQTSLSLSRKKKQKTKTTIKCGLL